MKISPALFAPALPSINSLRLRLLPYKMKIYFSLSSIGLIMSLYGAVRVVNTNFYIEILGYLIVAAWVCNTHIMRHLATISQNWKRNNPAYIGYISDVANGIMWALGISIALWGETSSYSILLFLGLGLWFKFLALMYAAPIDLGIYPFFVCCLLNQAVNYYKSKYPYAPYWYSLAFTIAGVFERIIGDLMGYVEKNVNMLPN